ncbi:unnamed protein product [Schistosoma curassoni]|uniref:Ribonuclease T(2) n=1 Tax=Schistosoma curassoni TaxID=6186 RepID=A0A183JZ95_9TREM|nr:unnamed protein product [Schistosoma curassoni]
MRAQPKDFPEKQPQCAVKEQFDIKKLENLLSDLKKLWPSLSNYESPESFWKHEFNRHGRCATEDPAIVNQHGYFKFGIDLMKKLHLLEKLIKNGIKPDQSKQYEKGVGRLEEVRICLNVSHNYMDCPVPGVCPNEYTFALSSESFKYFKCGDIGHIQLACNTTVHSTANNAKMRNCDPVKSGNSNDHLSLSTTS